MAGSIYTAIAGWTVLGGIGIYLYFINHQRKQRTRRSVPMRPAEKAIEPHKEPKARKSRKEGGHSSAEQDVRSADKGSKKRKDKVAEAIHEVDASPAATRDTDKDGDVEFARQLSSAKTGTLLGSKPQVAARQKSIKQSRAQEKPVVETSSDNATAPSSAAGGDADDDQSPVSSPELSTTTTNGDDPVADMLQPASPSASVLRIMESTTSTRPKKENRTQTYEPVETKKQRQNRKKAEAKKLALQEEEKERKILMERQRRSAREAEGRAAKDGSTFMASKMPSTSAWTAPPTSTNGQNGTNSKPLELLDTYESSSNKVTPTASAKVHSESQEKGNDLLNDPEEERQLRMAIQESNWEVVKEKKSRKGKKPVSEQDIREKQTTGATQTSAADQEDFGVPKVIEPTPAGQKWDMTLVSVDKDGEVNEYEKEVQDSEWEVA